MPGAIPDLIGLRSRGALLDELARGVALRHKLTAAVLVMAAGASLYGAALGSWRGGPQIGYAAFKLPLVLLVTAAITLLFNWMLAVLLGLRVRFAQVAVLTFLALAVAAVVLASLVPVAWLFAVTVAPPSPAARTTHNLLYLFHTVMVAGAGLAGMSVLWQSLERLAAEHGAGRAGSRRQARKIFAAWVLSFALVGGEVAWALRPFVGSIYFPSAFLRAAALDGNVYEFIARDIVPHLLFANRSEPTAPTGTEGGR
ncbi:MAG: hypothetical protein AAF657_25265 [Acidobacteriota bacterium]